MTASTDFDRLVATWLEQVGPADIAAPLVEDALSRASEVRQRRSSMPFAGAAPWPGTRSPGVGLRTLAIVVAASLAVTALVALGVAAIRETTTEPPAPPVVPSVAPPSLAPIGAPVPVAFRGRWVMDVPAGMGFGMPSGAARMALVITDDGRHAYFTTTARPNSVLMASTVGVDERGRLLVRTDEVVSPSRSEPDGDGISIDGVAIPGCSLGDAGEYALDPVTPTLLRVGLRRDDCQSRRHGFDGRWIRSHVGESQGGVGVLDVFGDQEPVLMLHLPAGVYRSTSDGLTDVTVQRSDGTLAVRAWKNPRVFADACDTSNGPIDRTTDARGLAEALALSRGIRVLSTTEVRVSNMPLTAVRIVVEADPGAACPSPAGWQDVEDVGTSGHVEPLDAPGSRELYAYDLGGDVYLVEIVGADDAERAGILESIWTLDSLAQGFLWPGDAGAAGPQ